MLTVCLRATRQTSLVVAFYEPLPGSICGPDLWGLQLVSSTMAFMLTCRWEFATATGHPCPHMALLFADALGLCMLQICQWVFAAAPGHQALL